MMMRRVFDSFDKASITLVAERLSKAPVGSSAKTMDGEEASARHKATRCFSPPDKVPAFCLAFSSRPNSWRRDKAFSSAFFFFSPARRRGRETFSKAEQGSINS